MKRMPLPTFELTADERDHLFAIINKGVHGARLITRARILFNLDRGQSNQAVCAALGVSLPSVLKIRARFVEGGLEFALNERPRLGSKPKLDEKQAAMITAIACSKAPDGHDHWTLRMLGTKIIELGYAESYSHESVRQLLKKTTSSPGKNKNGASQKSMKNILRAWKT